MIAEAPAVTAVELDHLEAALTYTRLGWYVVPACWPDADGRCACPRRHTNDHEIGKAPWLPRYQQLRPDEDQVRAWWTAWPQANVAVLLKPSGLLDIAPDSVKWWQRFQRNGLPRTAQAISGGGEGHQHYFYRQPEDGPEHRLCKPGEYDLLSDGIAILPPSRHKSGRRYGWILAPDELDRLPIVPLWALDMLRGAARPKDERTVPIRLEGVVVGGEPPVALDGEALQRWRGELVEANGEGAVDRSDSLFEIGRALAHAGADESTIAAAVAERDRTLGWNKYSTRRDDARRYSEIAVKASKEIASPRLRLARNDGTMVDPETGEIVAAPASAGGMEPYPWQSLAELVRSAPERDAQVVEGLLWKARLHWVFGQAGTGKTLLYLAAAMHVAAGKPFCGKAVMAGPVVVFEEDSPLPVIAGYVDDLADIYELDLEAMPFWITKQPGLRLTDEAGLRRAIAAVESAPALPTLIMLDASEAIVPSESFTPRELDYLKRFVQWCQAREITVIVIDHTRKLPQTKGDGPKPDPIDLLYGGLPKRATADVMPYLTGSIGKGGARITYVKFRGEAPAGHDVKYDGAAGFTITDLRRPFTESEVKVMAILNNSRAEWTEIATIEAALGSTPRRSLQRTLARLVEQGNVLREGEKKGTRYKASPGQGMFRA